MSLTVRVTIRGIEEWKSFLATVPRGVKGIAMRAFAEYVLGDANHGLRHYVPYKYVTRKSAYGVTFFSDAQRRWFWGHGGPSMIGNHRTGTLSQGWRIEGSAETRLYLINRVSYAGFVMGENQAAQPRKVGWRTAYDVVMSNFNGGIAAAQRAVDAWLNSK